MSAQLGDYPHPLKLGDKNLTFENANSEIHRRQEANNVPTYDEVDVEQQKKRLIHHKSRLLSMAPFFGTSVIQRKVEFARQFWGGAAVETAGVNVDGDIRMNPGFYSVLSPREGMFLIAHEAMHYQLGHAHRMRGKDPELWNIATDMVINGLLRDSNVGDMISGGHIAPDAHKYSAEALYRRLTQDNPHRKRKNRGQNGDGGSTSGVGQDLSSLGSNGQMPNSAQNKQKQVQAMSEMASQVSAHKNRGTLPGSVKEAFEDMTKVKTNWYDALFDYLQARRDAEDTRSFMRPNRRHQARGMRLPTTRPDPAMGAIVFGFDTSGSMSEDDLRVSWGHAHKAIEMCKPERVIALFADAQVDRVVELEQGEQLEDFRAYGRGGTSFQPVFDWIEENLDLEDIGAVIYLTDGFGDQDEFQPDCADKTVWVCTTPPDSGYDVPPFPWGKVIQHTRHEEGV